MKEKLEILMADTGWRDCSEAWCEGSGDLSYSQWSQPAEFCTNLQDHLDLQPVQPLLVVGNF